MIRRPRLSAVTLAVATVLTATLTGCNSSAPGDISADARRVLRPAVQNLREVAHNGRYAELKIAVNGFKDLVDQEQRAGEVSDSRALALKDAADALLLDAKPKKKPTPSATTTTFSPTPTPTTESPTPPPTTPPPSPTETSSPSVSASVSAQADSPAAKPAKTPKVKATASPG